MSPTIYPPEFLEKIDPKFHIEKGSILKTMLREIAKTPLAGVYAVDGSGKEFAVTILDIYKGLVVMKPETEPPGGFSSIIGTSQIVVACNGNSKMQFLSNDFRMHEDGVLMTCALPQDLIVIQRRKEFRTLGPSDEDFNFVLSLGAGQELLSRVIDISDHGILLDLRLDATEVEVGRYWHSGYFERPKFRSGGIDLIIRNVRPGRALDRIRAGCELYNPSKNVLKDFESTRTAIENARVAGRINRWYLSASWCE
ncbi:hypothetical protein [Polynucleobacter sp. MG-6-Vaara-E2]|jgi:hypothetical protein|uniref:hypothetical protein n=1 Tax=Polynucleobacter sp. MG-6-Vaara-E2 TaxID=2576932 RepID=UPI001BFE0449|nr:hypothetical protein [Polynucleobacter sp. MG-6-Vaara-E2]QWD96057.1 hypothetical protein ICV38_07255 [Polynucleobacter sp. MG-6-Vaara-E2]